MHPVRPGRWLPALVAAVAAPAAAPAQVVYPPAPEKVAVEFRYRIRADRDERVRQFGHLEAMLKGAGFDRDTSGELSPELDKFDPTAERMRGTMPSAGVPKLLADPRVKTVLTRPADMPVPDPAARVAVRVTLASGLFPAQQQRLHEQVVERLGKLGFDERVGYDTRGFTLVRGDLPAGNLFRLTKDLRSQPDGWFAAEEPAADLAPPLRDALAVRLVEVLPVADPAPPGPAPALPGRVGLTPDLRNALALPPDAAKDGLRVEFVTDRAYTPADVAVLRGRLITEYAKVAPDPVTGRPGLVGASLDGVSGAVVTIRFLAPADAARFAATEPGVVFARLPRAAVETAAPKAETAAAAKAALSATRLDALHAAGFTGKGVRVVVVGSAFPGAPAASVVDLTAELSPDLQPAPLPDVTDSPGLAAARAVRLAAPDAQITLVRIDPAAFFQLETVAKFVRGEGAFTEAMHSRLAELSTRAAELKRLSAEAVKEYQRALLDPSEEDRPKARREAAAKAIADLAGEEAKAAGAIRRANALQKATESLAGAAVVVNTLVWEAGVPLDGLSTVSRYIDEKFAGEAVVEPVGRSAIRPRAAARPLWVQAASPSFGSVWGGPFVDADGNGRGTWAPPAAALPKGEWSRELNFLAALAADGKVSPTLAKGTTLRLTAQWRETLDPEVPPVAGAVMPVTLRVFRQLDPEGKTRASDDLQEVARPVGGPYRLLAEPTYAVYEQIVEFTVPDDGRYAVLIEGRESFDPRLPALHRHVQVNPRVYAEFVGAAGRPVFASFAPAAAGVGAVGDAGSAVAAGPGLVGAGTGVTLRTKPNLLAPGAVGAGYAGNGVAAGVAGGAAAALIGAGATPTELTRAGAGPLAIPEQWLRKR